MSLEEELRPAYMRAADGTIELLSDPGALRRIAGEDPTRCKAFIALDVKELLGPHYLQVQVGFSLASLMDGYAPSEVGDMSFRLPTREQARRIAGFLSDGPRRASREVRAILDALLEAGVSPGTLRSEVDLATVRSVMDG